MMNRGVRAVMFGFLCLMLMAPGPAFAGGLYYSQTNLITSATDSDLINPWGISASAGSPFWVSDNGTGLADALQRCRRETGPGRQHAQQRSDHRAGLQWRVFELQRQCIHVRE